MKESAVLLVDDDGDAVLSLSRALKAEGLGLSISAETTASAALKRFKKQSFDVLVLDLSLDPLKGVESGFQVLREVLKIDPCCRVIILTGHGGTRQGVRALKEGAAHFIEKPANIRHLIALIQDAEYQAGLRREIKTLRTETASNQHKLVGNSELIEKLRDELSYAASTPLPVFLQGETGTGKGLCARCIHQQSSRASKSFVRFQPGAGGKDLTGSELFGHRKGAFTGADETRIGLIGEAKNGSLFLDEVDCLSEELQVSLLGVLQDGLYRELGGQREHKADIRLISASNCSIEETLSKGKIRQDFYHRISHIQIKIPPLRKRKEDIKFLVEHSLRRLQELELVDVFSCSDEAITQLKKHNWPGNVRELIAAVERAAYHAAYKNRPYLDKSDFLFLSDSLKQRSDSISFRDRVEDFKRELIADALRSESGNQVRAAEALNLDRSTMRRILARVG